MTGEAYEGKPSVSTVERDWWVQAKFQWGGLVGSKRERDCEVRVKDTDKVGFTEDDQEALFHLAHEGKIEKGTKRGLGGKGQIKMKSGEAYEGKKMKFSEEGELLAPGMSGGKKVEEAPVKEKKEKKAKKEKKEKKDKGEKRKAEPPAEPVKEKKEKKAKKEKKEKKAKK